MLTVINDNSLTVYYFIFTITTVQVKEKELFSLLKGNLNAVTPNDVTEELYRRMIDLIPSHLNFKLLDEANFLANFCLLCKCT